jgi:hypothetical protein
MDVFHYLLGHVIISFVDLSLDNLHVRKGAVKIYCGEVAVVQVVDHVVVDEKVFEVNRGYRAFCCLHRRDKALYPNMLS